MQKRTIIFLSIFPLLLTACHPNQEPPPAEISSSMCDILKQKLEAQVYKNYDEDTMKRKNQADQARLIQEYENYECPEFETATPPG